MRITKIGHCCLILEEAGVKIMTDPGSFTIAAQEAITGIGAILITHEHQDHFHADSVKTLLARNPKAAVVTNAAVGKLLKAIGVEHVQVGDQESADVNGIRIEGFGKDHAPIYDTMGLVENTAYRVAEKFYFPGDNFHVPEKSVDIVALPVAGPWMKMSEAIDFAKRLKARAAFGVHDAMIQPFFRGFVGNALKMFVPETEYAALKDGESREF